MPLAASGRKQSMDEVVNIDGVVKIDGVRIGVFKIEDFRIRDCCGFYPVGGNAESELMPPITVILFTEFRCLAQCEGRQNFRIYSRQVINRSKS